MSTLLAYHNDPKVKAKYLRRIRQHRKLDQLVKGRYWQDGKGCAIGCTIHGSNHAAYETELGIPQVLARLEDGIFEALDNGKAQEWPERFLSAIEPGADLSLVWPKFAIWLMVDPRWGVIKYAKSADVSRAILNVSDAYREVVEGMPVKSIDWRKLRNAASAAAASASAAAASAAAASAYAAYAYAAYAASASAYAAYAASASAASAYAAAYAYAASAAASYAAQKEAHIAQSDELIKLLQAAI